MRFFFAFLGADFLSIGMLLPALARHFIALSALHSIPSNVIEQLKSLGTTL